VTTKALSSKALTISQSAMRVDPPLPFTPTAGRGFDERDHWSRLCVVRPLVAAMFVNLRDESPRLAADPG
jgi:hypothetical protein